MTLDQYDYCPCGNGKKIKFCCSKDLLHDLDRLQRMIEGDQRAAARERIDQLLEKHPGRPSLLMMKCDLEMHAEERDKARATLAQLMQVQPTNAGGQGMSVILDLMTDRNLPLAVQRIQGVLEKLEGPVTRGLYDAIMMIGAMLSHLGQPFAAKGHLQFALALSAGKDQQVTSLMMEFNQDRKRSLLCREPLNLESCPANVTWKIEFDATMSEIHRGRWSLAAERLQAMSTRILDAPAILFNLGVVCAWTMQNDRATKAFRAFSAVRDVPQERRVHAAALAQELDPRSHREVSIVQWTFEADPFDQVLERCQSNHSLQSRSVEELPEPQEGRPRPRAVFMCFDRPITRDEIPTLDTMAERYGSLGLYGKETDRPARLVIECAETMRDVMIPIARTLLDRPDAEPSESVIVSKAPWWQIELLRSWNVPTGLPFEETRALISAKSVASLRDRWPRTPSVALDGKTPEEAARDGKQTVAVMADLLRIHMVCSTIALPFDEAAMRESLGLPKHDPIDPSDASFAELPIHRYWQLDVPTLDDQQLLTVYRRAYAVMNVPELRRIALEVVSRPSLDETIDKIEAYDILTEVATTSDEALKYIELARKLAVKEGESPADWLIEEANLRLVRSELTRFTALVREVQQRHGKEPGVLPALAAMFARHGLMTPDGRFLIPVPADAPAAAEASSESKLWTPDGAAPVGGEPSAAGESKLWIPGAD